MSNPDQIQVSQSRITGEILGLKRDFFQYPGASFCRDVVDIITTNIDGADVSDIPGIVSRPGSQVIRTNLSSLSYSMASRHMDRIPDASTVAGQKITLSVTRIHFGQTAQGVSKGSYGLVVVDQIGEGYDQWVPNCQQPYFVHPEVSHYKTEINDIHDTRVFLDAPTEGQERFLILARLTLDQTPVQWTLINQGREQSGKQTCLFSPVVAQLYDSQTGLAPIFGAANNVATDIFVGNVTDPVSVHAEVSQNGDYRTFITPAGMK